MLLIPPPQGIRRGACTEDQHRSTSSDAKGIDTYSGRWPYMVCTLNTVVLGEGMSEYQIPSLFRLP